MNAEPDKFQVYVKGLEADRDRLLAVLEAARAFVDDFFAGPSDVGDDLGSFDELRQAIANYEQGGRR